MEIHTWWSSRALVVRSMLVAAALAAVAGGAGAERTVTRADAATTAGLVAAFSFDAGSGTSASDASGAGNHGAISGATWTESGRNGRALSFDGLDDMVSIADSPTLDLTTGMTLEAWVYPTSIDSSWHTALLKEHSGGLSYALYANTGTRRAAGYARLGGDELGVEGGTTLPRDTWTHIASTYDGRNVRLWVNGVNVASRTRRGSLGTSDLPLRIGGNAFWGEWFAGKIDDVRVYDRALSQAELRADMQTAVQSPPPPPPPPPSTDTTPPAKPTGLTMAASSATSITLSWDPTSDNVGVAGHNLYRNGVRVGTTGATTYTFTYSGLTCATSYSLALEVYDAAGNTSVKEEATTVRSTAACPDPGPGPDPGSGGTRHVAPSGSDASPCTLAAPCATINRAYHLAPSGGAVELAAGTYPAQTLTADATKTGDGVVAVRPAAGATVTVASIYVGGASHLHFRGFTATQRITVENQSYGSPGSTNVTFEAITSKTIRIVGRVSNVTIRGGSYGNTVDNQPQVKKYNPTDPSSSRPYNTLIENASFLNFARSGSSVHTECLQILHADTITVRGNRFDNCDGTGAIGVTDGPTDNLTIENNFLGKGGDAYYTMQITKNTRNLVIRHNSSAKAFIFSDTDSGGPYLVAGNYAPHNSSTCSSGVTYTANVWAGGSCGSSDRSVAAMKFVNEGALDLHLAAGSEAVDSGLTSGYPATDIDGQARPLGARADAGADESR